MSARRTVAVVTGARSEFGLLRPVMDAIERRPELDLRVFVTGPHLLAPARTVDEVSAAFPIAATVEMQRDGEAGRGADAVALGRGVAGFAKAIDRHRPDVVLVLGDRIEALAAAAAAAVAGVRVAHMHGGDRAEGSTDEGIRHAITKLAHIHLPATEASAERLRAMGEEPGRVHLVGSPALDGLSALGPLDDEAFAGLGHPEIVFLLHPTDDRDAVEHERAARLLALCRERGRVLALHPTPDPGAAGIREAIASAPGIVDRPHLPRPTFVGALRRASMIVGNSSAGLIECAALPLRCVNVGSRQAGRERAAHVVDCPWGLADVATALDRAASEPLPSFDPPYGDGRAGERTAAVLATFEPDNHGLTKRNTY